MIVLKLGGSILSEGMSPTLLADIKKTLEADRLVIVHGGGDEVTRTAERLGKPQRFIVSPGGIRSRYTDRETVEIYAMVMAGKVNKETVALLLAQGIPALGLSGIDGGLLRAKRKKRLITVDERGRKRIIDGGYTGTIEHVNTEVIQLLLEKGYVPVVAPLAVSEESEPLNVDSDRAAAHLAGALGADRIVFLTDVEGLIMEGRLVRELSAAEAEGLLPKIGAGMDKKVLASTEAVRLGVGEAVIAPGSAENPVTQAVNHRTGTVISRG